MNPKPLPLLNHLTIPFVLVVSHTLPCLPCIWGVCEFLLPAVEDYIVTLELTRCSRAMNDESFWGRSTQLISRIQFSTSSMLFHKPCPTTRSQSVHESRFSDGHGCLTKSMPSQLSNRNLRMVLRQMKVELNREPFNIGDWVRDETVKPCRSISPHIEHFGWRPFIVYCCFARYHGCRFRRLSRSA